MGEKPDQIERHIYEQRNELGDNINELQQKVKTAVDWRAQVNERPGTMLGLAFGGGVLLSLLFGGRARRGRSSTPWPSDTNRRGLPEYSGTKLRDRTVDSAWDNIRGAVLAVAGAKLGGIIEEVLPGFQEQYRKRQYERRSSSRPNGPESTWGKGAAGEMDYPRT